MTCMRNRQNLMQKSFILSQFNDRFIILLCFFSNASNRKIEQIQKRDLRIVYNELQMSVEELLCHDPGVSVYLEYINTLLTAIFKAFSDENPYFMKSIFTQNDVMKNLRTSKTGHAQYADNRTGDNEHKSIRFICYSFIMFQLLYLFHSFFNPSV